MGERSTQDELRVGVVGVGQRAVLAEYANRPGYSRVVSCADPNERGRADALTLFGADVAVHDDYRDMVKDDLDAVFVFTPDYVHTEPVLHFLTAGVPVFVEKPLAISIEDCDAMLSTAASLATRLYVGHNLRHLPTLVKMRGYTVYETPVKHSARYAGTAKYGFRNRALVGIYDLFGVRWLKKRYLNYQVSEVSR